MGPDEFLPRGGERPKGDKEVKADEESAPNGVQRTWVGAMGRCGAKPRTGG